MRKQFLMLWLLIVGGVAWGQGQEGIGLDAANAIIWGQLPAALYPSGVLYDRTEMGSRIPEMEALAVAAPVSYYDWLAMYWEIGKSHRQQPAPIPAWMQLMNEVEEGYKITRSEATVGEGSLTVPIGILDFDYHRLRSDAISSGLAYWDADSVLQYAGGANPLEAHRVVAIAPMLQRAIEIGIYYFELDTKWLFSNCPVAELPAIDIDFGDGLGFQSLQWGEAKRVVYTTLGGVKEWQIRYTPVSQASYYRAAQITTTSAAEAGVEPTDHTKYLQKDAEHIDKEITFPDGNITYGTRVKVIYGCGNCENSCIVRKPVFLMPGFDPQDAKDAMWMITAWNTQDFLYDLHKLGYDLVLLDPMSGVWSVAINARLLMETIDWVNNTQKVGEEENVVIGYSAGALAARYALAKREHDMLQGTALPPHETRLFISSEGEHQGASIPLGAQYALDMLIQVSVTPNGAAASVLHGAQVLNSQLAKCLARYHYTASDNGPSPASERVAMLNDFASFNTGTHIGYPSLPRMIAISQGATTAMSVSPTVRPGDQLLTYSGKSATLGTKWLWYRSLNTGGDYFSGKMRRMRRDIYAKTRYALPDTWLMEHNNGSWLDVDIKWTSDKGNHRSIARQIDQWFVSMSEGQPNGPCGSPDCRSDITDCFVPLSSAFDIQNHTANDRTYDAVANQLLFTDGNSTVPNPNYGYPHVKHPTNYLQYTPFDAVFGWENNNTEHTPKNLSAALRLFMRNEIENPVLLLQNRVLPQVANSVYHAAHNADYIYTGKAVTALQHNGNDLPDITPEGNYVVPNSTRLALTAGHSIDFMPGFEAQAGSVLTTQLTPYEDCVPLVNKRKGAEDGAYTESLSAQALREGKVLLYPNPAAEACTVVAPAPIANIQLFDVQGKAMLCVMQPMEATSYQLLLSGLPSGIYWVRVTTNDAQIFFTKLSIQP